MSETFPMQREIRLVRVGLWMPPLLTLEAALIEHVPLFRIVATDKLEAQIPRGALEDFPTTHFGFPEAEAGTKPFWSAEVDRLAFHKASEMLASINCRVSLHDHATEDSARVKAPLFAGCSSGNAGWESDRCDTLLLDGKPWLADEIVADYEKAHVEECGQPLATHNRVLLSAMPVFVHYSYTTPIER